jgi:adenylosuccinate synthase
VFDAVAARYALAVCGGVDALAVTHLDRVGVLPGHFCTAYESRDGVLDARVFMTRDGRATDIRHHANIDLARQERLGEALGRCKPAISPLAGQTADTLLDQLRELLGVPIGVASHGPTANDKRVLEQAML